MASGRTVVCSRDAAALPPALSKPTRTVCHASKVDLEIRLEIPLVEAEGTLAAIERLARPKRKDSLEGFHTGFSDDEDDAPRSRARSRSSSNASCGSRSGYSSASTSRSNSRSPSPVRAAAAAAASHDETGFSWDSD